MTKARVVALGQARIDHLAVVDRYPPGEARVDLAGLSIQGGGAAVTALATLASLSVPVAYCGKLGDDDFGRFVLRGFEGLGIDTSNVRIQKGGVSSYSFIVLERGSRQRTVFQTRGSVDALRPDEIELSAIEQAEVLLVDGYQTDAQVAAAEHARQHGIKVVLDADRVHDGMGELVALSDVLIASERYASEVAPRGELEDSLVELSRMGPQAVVVTLGADGSIGLEGDKLVRQPPLVVDVVDTTGAGEAFLGGYCYGVLQDLPLERCIQLASATGGLACRELGSVAGLPSLDELEAVI